jgi:hypothetical protein
MQNASTPAPPAPVERRRWVSPEALVRRVEAEQEVQPHRYTFLDGVPGNPFTGGSQPAQVAARLARTRASILPPAGSRP